MAIIGPGAKITLINAMTSKNTIATLFVASLLAQTAFSQPALTTLFNTESAPQGGLALGGDGSFYGTTEWGGTYLKGSIFRVSTNGIFTTLASFAGTNGHDPQAALTLGNDGVFYGTTYYGGSTNLGYGTIFKVTTNGDLTTLARFSNTNGALPMSRLTFGNDGCLYGTTSQGGYTNLSGYPLSGGNGYGTVFRATTNGDISRLFAFSYTNGAFPYAGLTLGNDGDFYGVTHLGGITNTHHTQGCGTIFKITTNGVLTTLVMFSQTNGARACHALLANREFSMSMAKASQ